MQYNKGGTKSLDVPYTIASYRPGEPGSKAVGSFREWWDSLTREPPSMELFSSGICLMYIPIIIPISINGG